MSSVGAVFSLVSLALVCAGCTAEDGEFDDRRLPPAHLEIAAAVPLASQPTGSQPAGSQPAGVRIEVFRCQATRPTFTTRVSFSAGSLDELAAFTKHPVRLAKDHLFARSGVKLRHGCYSVILQPLDVHHRPIETCSPTHTAEMPLGPNARRSVLLVARCGDRPSDTPMVGGRLNFSPALSDLELDFDVASGALEVCAKTFDPEGDPVRVAWRARTLAGREIEARPMEVHHSVQRRRRSVACARLTRSDEPIELTAVARDGLDHSARGFLSFEAYRLYRYGVAAQSRGERTIRLPATLTK
jgi:hypothetical protein